MSFVPKNKHVLFGTKMIALLLGSMVFCLYSKTSGSKPLKWSLKETMRPLVLYVLTSPVFGNMSNKTIEPETVRFFCADNFWLTLFIHRTCRTCTVMKLDSQFHCCQIFKESFSKVSTLTIREAIWFLTRPVQQASLPTRGMSLSGN